MGCLIEPDRVADVGSQVVGLVERLHVERGARVAAGQLLVSLRADVERANARAAQTRSRADAATLLLCLRHRSSPVCVCQIPRPSASVAATK
jgi:multidrug efflux pump subunit AcrA (membrane-fusion protein)